MGSNPPNLNVLSEIALAKTKLQDLEAEVYTGSHIVDPAKEQSVERKMQQLGMERWEMDIYISTAYNILQKLSCDIQLFCINLGTKKYNFRLGFPIVIKLL